jgi:ATP-dependent Clp protease ATP-binding subunit ClpC
VFERFTDRARHVVVLAQEEARLLDHNFIGTEHILLGLIREEEGVAARALESLEIPLEAVRSQVEEILGRGQSAPTGHIPFTPRAKKVLELSLREALQLGHNYIGTEHILLGLIREGEGVAAQVLQTLGADLGRVRQTVIELLEGYTPDEPPESYAPFQPKRKGGRRRKVIESRPLDTPTCPSCGRDLVSQAAHRRLTLRNDPNDEIEILVVYCRSCGRTLGTSVI